LAPIAIVAPLSTTIAATLMSLPIDHVPEHTLTVSSEVNAGGGEIGSPLQVQPPLYHVSLQKAYSAAFAAETRRNIAAKNTAVVRIAFGFILESSVVFDELA
jgi:hypothetical protein